MATEQAAITERKLARFITADADPGERQFPFHHRVRDATVLAPGLVVQRGELGRGCVDDLREVAEHDRQPTLEVVAGSAIKRDLDFPPPDLDRALASQLRPIRAWLPRPHRLLRVAGPPPKQDRG